MTLIWNFLVNEIQFHKRGTFWASMLIRPSDILKVALPTFHPITPLNSDQPLAHIFSRFFQALLPAHLHSCARKGTPKIPGISGHSILLWLPDPGEKLTEGCLESGSPNTILRGPEITGMLKNFFKHKAAS